MTVHIENLKELIKSFLELIKDYSNVARDKVDIQKSIAFLYNSNEQVELEINNTFMLALQK